MRRDLCSSFRPTGERLARFVVCVLGAACSAGGGVDTGPGLERGMGAANGGGVGGRGGASSVIAAPGAPATAGSGATGANGAGGTGAVGPAAGGSAGVGNGGTGAIDACAVDTQLAALSPLNIVFVYDKSGSMGNPNDGFDPAARWDPMQTGMLAFFADPSSSSINAALSFFPVNGDLTTACGGPYDSPQTASPRGLALTPLNTDQGREAFVSLLANTTPQGGTPTLPALQGGIRLAQKVASDHPGAKTVVVLVTDGEPGFFVDGQVVSGCTDNDVNHVAQAAADAFAGTPSIATYVVGIGPSLDSLQAIAVAGGTQQATIMSDADPAATSKLFHDTLAAIRTETFSCDFPLPKAPPGQTLDSVNVAFASSLGAQATIPRNDACSPGGGWHYDSPTAPTKVVLCQDSCTDIQGDTKGQLSVVFGCATIVR